MTTNANTPAAPASTGLSTSEAASAFESLLSGPADTQSSDEDNGGNAEGHETETEHETETHESHESSETDEGEGEGEGSESDGEGEPEQRVDGNLEIPVEVDGKETKVKLDELKKGYLRQSDYTRKTQELSAVKTTLAQEQSQTQAERAKYAEALGQAESLIKQLEPQEPDWNALYQADPANYAATREMWRTWQEQKAAIVGQREQVTQAARAEQAKQQQAYIRDQAEKMVEAIPVWQDAKIAATEKEQLREYGRKSGFSDAELATIGDHRAIVMLRKAMLFDRMQGKRETVKPVPPTSKVRVATPGASAVQPTRTTEVTRQKQRLAKTGNVRDAAALLENFL